MIKIIALTIILFGVTGFFWKSNTNIALTPPKNFYEIKINDINKHPIKLEDYKNKVVLIVNVASKCGFTAQYEGLQELYDKYKDKNVVILGVPSNDFGNQEPGNEKDILSFCQTNYNVTFPLTEKVHVKSKDQHPLYTFLTQSNPDFSGPVKWNFSKFLVNQEGKVIKRFSSMTKPLSKSITSEIDSLIK